MIGNGSPTSDVVDDLDLQQGNIGKW